MTDCNQLDDLHFASKFLRDHGIGAMNKLMHDCGHVAKAKRPDVPTGDGRTIIKMNADFDKSLTAALGWDGAANYLRQHGEAALNDELKRRGIARRLHIETPAGATTKTGNESRHLDAAFAARGVPNFSDRIATTGVKNVLESQRAGTIEDMFPNQQRGSGRQIQAPAGAQGKGLLEDMRHVIDDFEETMERIDALVTPSAQPPTNYGVSNTVQQQAATSPAQAPATIEDMFIDFHPRQQRTVTRESVNGYDPMFPGMQVPLKK